MSDEKTVKLVYVGRHSEVEIPSLGIVAVRGEAIDVPESVAGTAPKGEPDAEGYDAGEGLLAQTDNWAKPGTKAAKEAPPPAETSGVELLDAAAPLDGESTGTDGPPAH